MATLELYLRGREADQKISDRHLSAISHSYCGKWRNLGPYLELDNIVTEDIKRSLGDEEDKRRNFLQKWRETKGSGATYRKLIGALLDIHCREDAEGVWKIATGEH